MTFGKTAFIQPQTLVQQGEGNDEVEIQEQKQEKKNGKRIASRAPFQEQAASVGNQADRQKQSAFPKLSSSNGRSEQICAVFDPKEADS